MNDSKQLTAEQLAELRRIKSYFPYRIVWGAISEAGEFECGANTTRRQVNALVRKGWQAWTI